MGSLLCKDSLAQNTMEETRPSIYKPQMYPKHVCISASRQASNFQGLLQFFSLIWIFIFPLSTLIFSASFISFFTEVRLSIPSAPANWHASFEVRETVPIYTTAGLFNIVLELQMGPSCKSWFGSKLTPNQGVFGFMVVVQTPLYGCVIPEREKELSEQNGGASTCQGGSFVIVNLHEPGKQFLWNSPVQQCCQRREEPVKKKKIYDKLKFVSDLM